MIRKFITTMSDSTFYVIIIVIIFIVNIFSYILGVHVKYFYTMMTELYGYQLKMVLIATKINLTSFLHMFE